MNREELAWAAGFFDGEGHTRGHTKDGRWPAPIMQVSQIDERPLIRFQAAVLGIGTIKGPRIPISVDGYSRKPYWYYKTTNWRDTQTVIALLWYFLSEPKRAQIAACFRRFHGLN